MARLAGNILLAKRSVKRSPLFVTQDAKGEVKEHLAYLQGYLKGLRAANDPFDLASSRN